MSATKGKVIKCRAAVAWEQSKPLTIEQIEVSPPKAKEIRVKIVATGVCHSDVSGWQGILPFLKFPLVLGHEGGGIVESVGEGVTSVKEGDHVLVFCMPYCKECPPCKSSETNLCMGMLKPPEVSGCLSDGTTRMSCKGKQLYHFMSCATYSEYTVIGEEYITKVDKHVSLDKINLLSCGVTTGYGGAVKVAKVKPGSTCAVFGLGTVGLAAVMGCKRAGAKRIIGVDINNGKKEIAKIFGVTEFYNPTEHEVSIDALLTEKTQGGCDYTFECIGNTGVIESALNSCRMGGGQCMVIGVPPLGKTIDVNPYQLLFGRVLTGSLMGGFRVNELPQLVEDYTNKKILLDEFITSTSPIEDVNKAFANLGKGTSIKTVLYF